MSIKQRVAAQAARAMEAWNRMILLITMRALIAVAVDTDVEPDPKAFITATLKVMDNPVRIVCGGADGTNTCVND